MSGADGDGAAPPTGVTTSSVSPAECGCAPEISEAAGVVLASHAAVAFSGARTYAQMEQAIATRHQIGDAMGILMAGHHLTAEEAFGVLGSYSQESNVKLREVARRICEEGGLAPPCRPGRAPPPIGRTVDPNRSRPTTWPPGARSAARCVVCPGPHPR